jgi:hypothetical protein
LSQRGVYLRNFQHWAIPHPNRFLTFSFYQPVCRMILEQADAAE